MPNEPQHSKRWRFYLVLILLLQLFLRTYDILALPGYADESHHIRRAEVAWDFNVDPYASYNPGKLMLYYYLGLFETERVNYLLVSRLAVALITLLGGAAIYAVSRRMFEERIALMVMFVYAVMPFAIFYDRMALADPLTLVMVMLADLGTLRWLDRPTLKMGFILGLLLILPPLAKLTAMAVVAAPIAAVWIYRRGRWRDYIKSGLVAYGVLAAFWIPMFMPTVIGEIRGDENRVVLVGDYLLNVHEADQGFIANLADNIWASIEQTAIFYWTPALLLTLVGWLVLVRYRPQHGQFLGVMLVLAWLPTIALGSYPSSRYLEIGVPILILMLVGGLYHLARRLDDLDRQAVVERALMLGLGMYGLAWGLPFFQQAVTNPADLTLPEEARWRYIQSTTAGYGQREAVEWLEHDATISEASGQVEVYAVLGSCHLMRLFLPDPGIVHLTCSPLETGRQLSAETIEAIRTSAADNDGIYMLLERELESSFDDLPVEWEFVRLFPRPHDGVDLELWRIRAGEETGIGETLFPPRPASAGE